MHKYLDLITLIRSFAPSANLAKCQVSSTISFARNDAHPLSCTSMNSQPKQTVPNFLVLSLHTTPLNISYSSLTR